MTTFLDLLLDAANAIEHAAPQASRQRFNPRPAGVIRPGRSSEMVLKVLRDHGGLMTEGQIRYRTGLNHSRASWALLFLQNQGHIEAMPETFRNSRYKRYRAKVGGISDE